MQRSCLISVIVPVYNADKYLRNCVDSILAQTFTQFEVILVDDGSSDNSDDICDEYAQRDNRIRVVHQTNGGEMAARAAGVRLAKGDWLYFVDSDDSLRPNALKQIYSSVRDDVDVIVHEYHINANLTKEQYIKLLLGFKSWTLWGKLIRREVLDEYSISVPRVFRVGEDLLTQIRMMRNVMGSIVMEDVSNYIYNTENENSVQRTTKKDYSYEKMVVEEVDKNLRPIENRTVEESLFHWEMGYLYGMIGYKYSVNYGDEWISRLVTSSSNYRLKWREKIVMKSILQKIYRIIPRMERMAKDFLRKVLR